MTDIAISHGVLEPLEATLFEKNSVPVDLGSSTVVLWLRLRDSSPKRVITRNAEVTNAQTGEVKYVFLESDFDGELYIESKWDIRWHVSPPPFGSSGIYPSRGYDILSVE